MTSTANGPPGPLAGFCFEVSWDRPVVPAFAVRDLEARNWAVVHGWISNRRELAAVLAVELPPADTSGLGSLLLQAWRRWGPDVVERVCGECCFAIWDDRLGELFAASDLLGARPIFYAEAEGRIALATGSGALCGIPWVRTEPDERAIVAFLEDLDVGQQRSFRRGISRLPGGHAIQARQRVTRIRQYFRPPFAEPVGILNVGDFVQEYRARFFQAVEGRLAPAGTTGILMSGGFDSTAIAAVATRIAGRDSTPPTRSLAIYSGLFPGLACDESARVRSVVAHLGIPATLLTLGPTATDPAEWEREVRRHDAPYIALQRPIFLEYFAAMRRDAVGVVLGGIGGDEMAVDWQYEVDALRQARARDFPATLRRAANVDQVSTWAIVRRALANGAPPWWQFARAQLRRVTRRGSPEASLCHPAFSRLLHDLRREDRFRRSPFVSHTLGKRWQALQSPKAQRARAWWQVELGDAGLDGRFPFHDRRLAELIFGSPVDLQPRTMATGLYKPAIALGTGDLLPPHITARYHKVFFDDYESSAFEANQASIRDILESPTRLSIEEFLRPGLVVQKNRARMQGPSRGLILDSVQQWLRILGIEIWLRSRQAMLASLGPVAAPTPVPA